MNTQSLRLLNTLPPLDALVSFEAVARCGSFTRAARELSITQSAVSKQIKGLEEALRCALFDRHVRGIQLSAAGASFLEELEPLLYKLHRAVLRVQHEHDTQAISIACTQAVAHFWLFPRVVRFNQTYPDIAVNIISSNAINERSCNDSDFGILYGDGDWPSLDGTRLFPEIVYPVCSTELSLPQPESVVDLCSLPLIQLDSRAWDCMDWQDWFKHFGLIYDIPRNAITFNQVTLVFNAALEGLGVSLGWDYMARQAIESGKLRQLGGFAYETGRWDYLVHAKHRPLTEPAQIFHDWLM
jgi:LysR family glycine cleavage system transcriptional activator